MLERARAVFGFTTTQEHELYLLDSGFAVAPCWTDGTSYRFTLPLKHRDLRLMSRRWVPAQLLSARTDTRVLGVCLRRLDLDGCRVPLNDAALAVGWHPPEQDTAGTICWTRGDALLPGPASEIIVTLEGVRSYWSHAETAASSVQTRSTMRRA